MIDGYPDSSRVWVFGADRPLVADEVDEVREVMRRFVATWSSHNVPVEATADVLNDRFVVVALDDEQSTSGCSIDKLFKQIGELEQRYGLRLLDSDVIFYGHAPEKVESTSREGFRALAADGVVSEETAVYDPTIDTLAQLRRNWPSRAGESWHRQLLRQR